MRGKMGQVLMRKITKNGPTTTIQISKGNTSDIRQDRDQIESEDEVETRILSTTTEIEHTNEMEKKGYLKFFDF